MLLLRSEPAPVTSIELFEESIASLTLKVLMCINHTSVGNDEAVTGTTKCQDRSEAIAQERTGTGHKNRIV
jgi:hypothetical protein